MLRTPRNIVLTLTYIYRIYTFPHGTTYYGKTTDQIKIHGRNFLPTNMEVVLTHTVHSHLYSHEDPLSSMKTEDVDCQIMKNDLTWVMQEWLCTSKQPTMTRYIESLHTHLPNSTSWEHLLVTHHDQIYPINPPRPDISKEQWELF